MKKLLSVLLALVLFLPAAAVADVEIMGFGSSVWYVLQPGQYEIGKDIPAGTYDVRCSAEDDALVLTFSQMLDENGDLDMSWFYSFQITVSAGQWKGGCHPVIYMPSYGYLTVQGPRCRLYPVALGY